MKFKIFKNKVAGVICAITFSAGLFSCHTELLEPTNTTFFSDLVVFDTPQRIELQANNLYTSVKAGAFYAGRYIVYGDIRANDFLNLTANGVTGYGVWNHSLNETSINDVNNMWIAAYAAINQINVFIKGMEDNAGKFTPPIFAADFATVTAPQYIAEARMLRALIYYSLLQFYARPYADGAGSEPGLPLRLNAEKNSANNDLARSTVAEVYAQIIADLDFAEANLPVTRGVTPANALLRVTRAHRNTAIALKTRVYLSMGDYANVVAEATPELVPQATAPFSATSGVAHALNGTIGPVFASPQETIESILSFPFSTVNAPGTQNQLRFYWTAEYNLNTAAGSIYADNANWPAADARRAFVVPSGANQVLGGKYPSGTPFLDKAPVIRYSEVMLNLAEALARQAVPTDPPVAKALALLNAVRQRSDATFTWAPADNAALINAILTERRIEFLGEGLRNIDDMRLLRPLAAKAAIPAVNPADLTYIWPIPSSELATNALMTRNE
jgi:hypothetical protein